MLPSHTDAFSPLPQCGSLYLQEWNKVILFQVITARLGQEMHKFRSIIVAGLQSSGEKKKEETDGCKYSLMPSLLFYPYFLVLFNELKMKLASA